MFISGAFFWSPLAYFIEKLHATCTLVTSCVALIMTVSLLAGCGASDAQPEQESAEIPTPEPEQNETLQTSFALHKSALGHRD